MKIKEEKFFDMVATITAGVMANPNNASLITDSYGQQQIIQDVMAALQQTMVNAGVTLIQTESP